MINYKRTLNRLQTAINRRPGVKILITTTQWYSDRLNKPVTMYHIKQWVKMDDGTENVIEIFTTPGLVQAILFLRDFWYELNGWEVPTDNQKWNEVKEKWQNKQNKNSNTSINQETKK